MWREATPYQEKTNIDGQEKKKAVCHAVRAETERIESSETRPLPCREALHTQIKHLEKDEPEFCTG